MNEWLADERLTFARQKAIDDLLRLMGCTDLRSSNCEHVAAVAALTEAVSQTTWAMLNEACGGALADLGLTLGRPVTMIRPGVKGRREGKLR